MYGGYTGDVQLDIVQIPYGYRTDITEPLPLTLTPSRGLGLEPEQWPVVHPRTLAIVPATILNQAAQCTSETTSPGPRVTVLSAKSSAGADFLDRPVE